MTKRLKLGIALSLMALLAGCGAVSPAVEELAEQVPTASEESGEAPDQPVDEQPDTSEVQESASKYSLDAYSWDELADIAQEIGNAGSDEVAIEIAKQHNLCNADGTLDGTQAKSVTLSDGTETSVQIAGFSHDNKTGGGKAGITFIFAEPIAAEAMNSSDTNEGGWEGSEMRSWLGTEGIASLPSDLANQIVAVDKLTNNVGETVDLSSVTTTSDNLWLFSLTELCGEIDRSWSLRGTANEELDAIANAEGTQYQLFANMNVTDTGDNPILERDYPGTFNWFLRTPDGWSEYGFCGVMNYGSPSAGNGDAGRPGGVVPGFCL